jgi:hypothetical protein
MPSVVIARKSGTCTFHRLARSGVAVCIFACALAAPAHAATKVAIIDDAVDPPGTFWCSFLNDNGYECTLFPASGPTQPLGSFAVVIDMSGQWADPQHSLAAFMQTGKGVITWGTAPFALGINNDSIVQEWIGANLASSGTDLYVTTATDSILGDRPPGTVLGGVGEAGAEALDGTAGHPDAKILARFTSGIGQIALLRNRWEGGRSVYFSSAFSPGSSIHADIILRAMTELSVQIPATSTWGCFIFALSALTTGSIIVRDRTSWRRRGSKCRNGAPQSTGNLQMVRS